MYGLNQGYHRSERVLADDELLLRHQSILQRRKARRQAQLDQADGFLHQHQQRNRLLLQEFDLLTKDVNQRIATAHDYSLQPSSHGSRPNGNLLAAPAIPLRPNTLPGSFRDAPLPTNSRDWHRTSVTANSYGNSQGYLRTTYDGSASQASNGYRALPTGLPRTLSGYSPHTSILEPSPRGYGTTSLVYPSHKQFIREYAEDYRPSVPAARSSQYTSAHMVDDQRRNFTAHPSQSQPPRHHDLNQPNDGHARLSEHLYEAIDTISPTNGTPLPPTPPPREGQPTHAQHHQPTRAQSHQGHAQPTHAQPTHAQPTRAQPTRAQPADPTFGQLPAEGGLPLTRSPQDAALNSTRGLPQASTMPGSENNTILAQYVPDTEVTFQQAAHESAVHGSTLQQETTSVLQQVQRQQQQGLATFGDTLNVKTLHKIQAIEQSQRAERLERELTDFMEADERHKDEELALRTAEVTGEGDRVLSQLIERHDPVLAELAVAYRTEVAQASMHQSLRTETSTILPPSRRALEGPVEAPSVHVQGSSSGSYDAPLRNATTHAARASVADLNSRRFSGNMATMSGAGSLPVSMSQSEEGGTWEGDEWEGDAPSQALDPNHSTQPRQYVESNRPPRSGQAGRSTHRINNPAATPTYANNGPAASTSTYVNQSTDTSTYVNNPANTSAYPAANSGPTSTSTYINQSTDTSTYVNQPQGKTSLGYGHDQAHAPHSASALPAADRQGYEPSYASEQPHTSLSTSSLPPVDGSKANSLDRRNPHRHARNESRETDLIRETGEAMRDVGGARLQLPQRQTAGATPPPEVVDVQLCRNPEVENRFGIVVRGHDASPGGYVMGIRDYAVFGGDQVLELQDHVWEVDGVDVRGKTGPEIVDQMKHAGRTCHLRVLRHGTVDPNIVNPNLANPAARDAGARRAASANGQAHNVLDVRAPAPERVRLQEHRPAALPSNVSQIDASRMGEAEEVYTPGYQRLSGPSLQQSNPEAQQPQRTSRGDLPMQQSSGDPSLQQPQRTSRGDSQLPMNEKTRTNRNLSNENDDGLQQGSMSMPLDDEVSVNSEDLFGDESDLPLDNTTREEASPTIPPSTRQLPQQDDFDFADSDDSLADEPRDVPKDRSVVATSAVDHRSSAQRSPIAAAPRALLQAQPTSIPTRDSYSSSVDSLDDSLDVVSPLATASSQPRHAGSVVGSMAAALDDDEDDSWQEPASPRQTSLSVAETVRRQSRDASRALPSNGSVFDTDGSDLPLSPHVVVANVDPASSSVNHQRAATRAAEVQPAHPVRQRSLDVSAVLNASVAPGGTLELEPVEQASSFSTGRGWQRPLATMAAQLKEQGLEEAYLECDRRVGLEDPRTLQQGQRLLDDIQAGLDITSRSSVECLAGILALLDGYQPKLVTSEFLATQLGPYPDHHERHLLDQCSTDQVHLWHDVLSILAPVARAGSQHIVAGWDAANTSQGPPKKKGLLRSLSRSKRKNNNASDSASVASVTSSAWDEAQSLGQTTAAVTAAVLPHLLPLPPALDPAQIDSAERHRERSKRVQCEYDLDTTLAELRANADDVSDSSQDGAVDGYVAARGRLQGLLLRAPPVLLRALLNVSQPRVEGLPDAIGMLFTAASPAAVWILVRECFHFEVEHPVSPQELLRGNTRAVRIVCVLLRATGNSFLSTITQGLFESFGKNPELYTLRGKKSPKQLRAHQLAIASAVQEVLNSLYQHVNGVPPVLRTIASTLRQEVLLRYPGQEHICVRALLFLRYMVPAIADPVTFGLLDEASCNPQVAEAALVVSQVLQAVANDSPSSGSAASNDYKDLIRHNRSNMTAFIDTISTPLKGGQNEASASLVQLGQLVKPQVPAALDVLADFCLAHQPELQGWFEEPVTLPSSQRPLGHIALERFLHANLLSSAQYTTAAEIQDSEAILERKSIAKHGISTKIRRLSASMTVYIGHDDDEPFDLAPHAFLRGQAYLPKLNRQFGDSQLQSVNEVDIFGRSLNVSSYLRSMKSFKSRVPCFRELISPAAIERVCALVKRRWLRNPDGIGIGKALAWRVRQRAKTVKPEDADILFLMGQTKATMDVYERLKQLGALTKPILLSVAPRVFPVGLYKLPAPWQVANRSLLRTAMVSRVQDVRVPHFSHVIPFGKGQLSDIAAIFEPLGRKVLLSFVGGVKSTFFDSHLTRCRLELVDGLLTYSNAYSKVPAPLTRLFASPFLTEASLLPKIKDRFKSSIDHHHWNRLSMTQLTLTMTLYASSVFVLCVAGDTNLRQAIYDAWYMGAIPVIYSKQLLNIQSFFGGLRLQTTDEVRDVVADFAFGTDPGDMLDKLLIMAQTGVAARKQQAIRAMVDAFVFRRDELHPDALSWALAALVWRKEAGIKNEQLNATVLAPWEFMWPDCLCAASQKPDMCLTETCKDSFLPPDDW